MPKHRRVLGRRKGPHRDRDDHDHGRHLHSRLPILRRSHQASALSLLPPQFLSPLGRVGRVAHHAYLMLQSHATSAGPRRAAEHS